MENNHRRFLLRVFLVVSLLGLGNLALNVLLDVYQIFGTPAWPGVNAVKHGVDRHARVAKAYAVKRLKPQVVLLGSSRAESTLDPAHPLFAGLPTYNLAFPGAASYELLRYLQHASGENTLDRAVVALDFHQFLGNTQSLSTEFKEERLSLALDGQPQPFPWRDMLSLSLSGSAFKEAWWSLRHQRDRRSIYRSDGYRDDRDDIPAMLQKAGGQRAEFVASERGYVRVYRRGAAPVATDRIVARQAEQDVAAMLALAAARRFDIVFVLPPVHVRHLALIEALGRWDQFEKWKRDLAGLSRQAPAGAYCRFWDFSTVNALATETLPEGGSTTAMTWWRESSHATRAAGWAMLDVIAGKPVADGFGDCLDRADIDAMLRRERRRLAEWVGRNPAEMAEIQELANHGL